VHECPVDLPDANGVCPNGEANRKGETYGYDVVYRLINRKEGDLNGSGVLQTTGVSSPVK